MGLWRRRGAPLLHVAIDEGEGPVVILVHGIASSSVTFQELVPRLSGAHRVIALDILGFGASPTPVGSQFTIDDAQRRDAAGELTHAVQLREVA